VRGGAADGGATAIPADPTRDDAWEIEGSLDADRGDPVDWLVLELEPGFEHELLVSVVTVGSRDAFDGGVYAADGELLAIPPPSANRLMLDESRSVSVKHVVDRVFVRVGTTDSYRRGDYQVTVTHSYKTALPDPNAPPPCDPEAFDPRNPNCAGECDYQHPDAKNPKCCEMWEKCRQRNVRYCESLDVTVDGDTVWIPLGTRQGLFGEPSGRLFLSKPEPVAADDMVQYRRQQPITLTVREIQPDRSQWWIDKLRDHDGPWVLSHVYRVQLERPWQCP